MTDRKTDQNAPGAREMGEPTPIPAPFGPPPVAGITDFENPGRMLIESYINHRLASSTETRRIRAVAAAYLQSYRDALAGHHHWQPDTLNLANVEINERQALKCARCMSIFPLKWFEGATPYLGHYHTTQSLDLEEPMVPRAICPTCGTPSMAEYVEWKGVAPQESADTLAIQRYIHLCKIQNWRGTYGKKAALERALADFKAELDREDIPGYGQFS